MPKTMLKPLSAGRHRVSALLPRRVESPVRVRQSFLKNFERVTESSPSAGGNFQRHHHFVDLIGQKGHVTVEKGHVHAAGVLARGAADTNPCIPGSFDAESWTPSGWGRE